MTKRPEVVIKFVHEWHTVGMFRSIISCSETLSRYFTRARRLLPWPTINTSFPDWMLGAIS
jgi:hypothetical protein